MANDNTPATGSPEVSPEESFEQYEARFLAKSTEEPSDAAPVKDARKTVSESETEEDTEPEADNDASDDEEAEEEDKPKKSKGGFQRRIDKLSGRIKDLESQLAAKPAGAATTETEAPAATNAFHVPKPKLEDFDSIEAFTDPEQIDPLYYSGRTYYLAPAGPAGAKSYAVLQRVLKEKERWALAQRLLSR